MLVIHENHLENIFLGVKTIELRGSPLSPGWRYLACHRYVYGCAKFGQAMPIRTLDEFCELRDRHCLDSDELPYKKTCGLPILEVRGMIPMPYQYLPGQIGTPRFRPAKQTLAHPLEQQGQAASCKRSRLARCAI